jgi:hypothetical protein
MANGNNKGYGYMDNFVVSLEILIEQLQAARHKAAPELEKALERWIVAVERDAKANLNRPHWFLQQNISSKVKAFQQNHKIWAMTGFRFQNKSNPRDPGYYGKFHEAGWAPDRKVVKVPHHFLRSAKKKNRPTLEKELQATLSDVMDLTSEIMAERRRYGGEGL